MSFLNQLEATIRRNSSLLVVGLDPNLEMMSDLFRIHFTGENHVQQARLISAMRDWLRWVIAQTCNFVCAYKPTLGFYQALGSAGLDLLQDVLSSIPAHIPVILDAKHSDLNTSSLIAQTVFTQWQFDAITLNAYPGQDLVAPFLVYPGKAVFVQCCTANPSAASLQHYPADAPFYLQVVQAAKTWGTIEAHGTRRLVEGNFEVGETIVVVDDILISGNSAIEGAAKLESVGAHSVLTLSEVTQTLYQAGRISESEMQAFVEAQESSC